MRCGQGTYSEFLRDPMIGVCISEYVPEFGFHLERLRIRASRSVELRQMKTELDWPHGNIQTWPGRIGAEGLQHLQRCVAVSGVFENPCEQCGCYDSFVGEDRIREFLAQKLNCLLPMFLHEFRFRLQNPV